MSHGESLERKHLGRSGFRKGRLDITASLDGDGEAYRQLVQRYQGQVAAQMCGSPVTPWFLKNWWRMFC